MMSIKHRVVVQRIFAFLFAATLLFGWMMVSFAPQVIHAADTTSGSGDGNVSGSGDGSTSGSGSGGNETYELANPLKAKSIDAFILSIIEVIMVFLIPIIVLYIMYAGFLFVTARGNATQIADAKRALLYAIIGGVIVVGAKLIIDVIQGTVDAFKAGP